MQTYIPNNSKDVVDCTFIVSKPYKVLSLIDASCPSCIVDINKWGEIANTFFSNQISIIMVCHSKDNFEYLKFLFEDGKIRKLCFPIFLDSKDLFYKKNQFIRPDISHQSFLLDSRNKIVATGSPIHFESIKDEYIRKRKN